MFRLLPSTRNTHSQHESSDILFAQRLPPANLLYTGKHRLPISSSNNVHKCKLWITLQALTDCHKSLCIICCLFSNRLSNMLKLSNRCKPSSSLPQ